MHGQNHMKHDILFDNWGCSQAVLLRAQVFWDVTNFQWSKKTVFLTAVGTSDL